MRLSKIIFLLFTILFIFSGCQKELSNEASAVVNPNTYWVNNTPLPTVHPVGQLLNSLQPADIIINMDNDSSSFSNFGTISLTIPKKCFSKLNNGVCTGPITVKIKKATKFSEMIYYKLSTLTNSDLLSTAGMINIEASQGTELLKIANGKTVEVIFQNAFPKSYKAFSGVVSSTESINPIKWSLNNMFVDSIGIGQPTGNGYTRIKIDSCQWVNCDYFYSQPNPTNIYLKLPAEYGNVNTQCYIIFRTDKVMSGMYADVANQQFWQGASYKVPLGKNVRLVAISKRNNKNYYGSADVTIANNMTVTIATMDEVTDTDLQSRLNAL